MNRLIIGLVGPISSGKGILGEYLRGHGFFYTSTSNRVREEAGRRKLPMIRKNLQNVGNDLRRSEGVAVLVERSLPLIPDWSTKIVIDGIRNPGEALFVKEKLGGIIIGVDAPAELRLKWYLERAGKRGEDEVSLEDFRRANDRDLGFGEEAFGQQGKETFALVDFVVNNDGTDKMMKECGQILREKFGVDLESRNSGKEIWTIKGDGGEEGRMARGN